MTSEKLKWFNQALSQKLPGTTLEDLSALLRVETAVFIDHINQGLEFDSMAGSVLQGLLGGSLSEFVESGQAEALDSAAEDAVKTAPADFSALLEKARRIFEAGGPQAEALAIIIGLMRI